MSVYLDRIERLRDRLRGSVAMRGDGAMVGVEPRELTALLDAAEVAEQLAVEIEARQRHDEWRAAVFRRMSVPFHGALAGATPATMGVLSRWLRDLRRAQGGES